MDIFTLEDFKALAFPAQDSCVSVYLRMHEKGRETRQNPIRLKNALSAVKEELEALPQNASKMMAALEPIENLLEDGAFWRNQSRGLAIFIAPDTSRVYRLPLDFEDLHIVSNRFHLVPVLPLISENLRFYVLALSQNSTRFYRCDRLHVEPLTVEGLPESIDDALQYEMEQRQFQFYTGAPVSRGTQRRAAVFHGQGLPADAHNDKLLRYCRMIDAAIYEVLRNETAPLIVAGVEYLLAIFRNATEYPYLSEEGIIGNPEHASAAELQRKGWLVVSNELQLRREQAIAKFNQLKGTGLATAELPSILRCAFDGRIHELIVGSRMHQWGKCDGFGSEVEIYADRKHSPGACDLIDVAACETIMKGGDVWSVDTAQVPDHAPIVATLRF